MVYIESAFLGDEKDARDVSKVLRDKVVGTTIKVPVDNKLIPPFVVTNKAELSKDDERRITESAERQCGGADQNCIEVKKSELKQQMLLSKASESASTANIVKGRRLTVNVRDEGGKLKTVVVPEGQVFELEGISGMDPRKPPTTLPSLDSIKSNSLEFATIAVLAFFWVFGVAATYALFTRKGWGYIAAVLAFIAFLIPGSGYIMIFGYFIIESFVDKYTSMV